MKSESRYKGVLNSDYALIMKAFPHEKELRRMLAHEICFSIEGGRLLELGSGSGEATWHILDALRGKEIAGYDSVEIDPASAERQRMDLEEFGTLSVFAEDAVAFLSRCAADAYDAVSSSWFLHNFSKEDREEMLGLMLRTLKPRGSFFAMDKYVPDDPKEAERMLAGQIRRFRIYDAYGRPDLREAMEKHEAEDAAPEFVMKEIESVRAMESIGFSDVRIAFRSGREAVLVARK